MRLIIGTINSLLYFLLKIDLEVEIRRLEKHGCESYFATSIGNISQFCSFGRAS